MTSTGAESWYEKTPWRKMFRFITYALAMVLVVLLSRGMPERFGNLCIVLAGFVVVIALLVEKRISSLNTLAMAALVLVLSGLLYIVSGGEEFTHGEMAIGILATLAGGLAYRLKAESTPGERAKPKKKARPQAANGESADEENLPS